MHYRQDSMLGKENKMMNRLSKIVVASMVAVSICSSILYADEATVNVQSGASSLVIPSGSAAFTPSQHYVLTANQKNFTSSIAKYFNQHSRNYTPSMEMNNSLKMMDNLMVYAYNASVEYQNGQITQTQFNNVINAIQSPLTQQILNYNINKAMLETLPVVNQEIGACYAEPILTDATRPVSTYYLSLLNQALGWASKLQNDTTPSAIIQDIQNSIILQHQANGVLSLNNQDIPVNSISSFSNYSVANFTPAWINELTLFSPTKIGINIDQFPYGASNYTYAISQKKNIKLLAKKLESAPIPNTIQALSDYLKLMNNVMVYGYFVNQDYSAKIISSTQQEQILNSLGNVYNNLNNNFNTLLDTIYNSPVVTIDNKRYYNYSIGGQTYKIPTQEIKVLYQLLQGTLLDNDPTYFNDNFYYLNQLIATLDKSNGVDPLFYSSNSNAPAIDLSVVATQLYFPQTEMNTVIK